jgi:hypothetical protein
VGDHVGVGVSRRQVEGEHLVGEGGENLSGRLREGGAARRDLAECTGSGSPDTRISGSRSDASGPPFG